MCLSFSKSLMYAHREGESSLSPNSCLAPKLLEEQSLDSLQSSDDVHITFHFLDSGEGTLRP